MPTHRERAARREHTLIFYDGHCGLCHSAALFALRRDPDGSRFRFAPLQGDTLRQSLPASAIADLTDSIVVLGLDGMALQESDAIISVLEEIGGGWRTLGRLCGLVPRPLRDFAYRAIARARRRLFRSPPGMCPVVPTELETRFLP